MLVALYEHPLVYLDGMAFLLLDEFKMIVSNSSIRNHTTLRDGSRIHHTFEE